MTDDDSFWDRPRQARSATPQAPHRHRAAPTGGMRRALLLIGMTLVLPGSAQLLAGSKAVGRAAVRVLVLLAVAAGVVWWRLGRNGIVVWSLHPAVLSAVEATLAVLGLCWAALLVDAWRLGRPRAMGVAPRVLCTGLALGMIAAIGTPVTYAVQLASAQRDLITTLIQPGPVAKLYEGRLNIAILGGDGGLDRSGIRTDQDAVASIDVHTGKALLISIPRNLQYAQFPPGSPLANKFPDGFPQFFYSIYEYGSQHPELFPGSRNPGATATESAMAQMLGIPIQYYVTLNLQGFTTLIDSLGGLTIRVAQRLPIGGGHKTGACDLPGGGCREGAPNPILGYIEPGLQKLDGYHALWYARSRSSTTDYDRMSRERCVLNGILKQMDPLTVLTHYKSLVSSAKNVVKTDLTQGALDVLVKTAAATKKSNVTDLQLQPPLIDPQFPAVQPIRDLVRQAIDASNAVPTTPTYEAASRTTPKNGKKAQVKPATTAPPGAAATVSLDQVCQYS